MAKTEYAYYVKYKDKNGYTHYGELKATSREDAIREVNQLPNLKTLYEIYRRAKEKEQCQ
jgi:hypothetical protein